MKKIFFVFLFLNFFAEGNLFAQGEANIWHFGHHAGIDFNSGSAIAISSPIYTTEGVASVCDSSGIFLFSTDGDTIYNSIGGVMATGLFGSFTSTQSALIVPFPDDNSKYYVFTADALAGTHGICYSIIDMTLNGGLGGVVSMNIQLISPACEKLTGVKNTNGTDYWVIAHAYPTNEFYVYPITPSGVGLPIISPIGTNINGASTTIGYLKCSPDRHKLVAARYVASDTIDMFDFNDSSGIISNYLPIPSNGSAYGISFSPNSTKLYIAYGFSSTIKIQQFDLTLTNFQNFPYTLKQGTTVMYGALQLAPDGKIYCSKVGETTLDVINNPNSAGFACNYSDSGFTLLSGTVSQGGLPNFIENYFSEIGESSVTISPQKNFIISPNPATNEIKITNLSPTENQISIFNLLGQQVKSIRVSHSQTTTIPVSDLPAGIYTVTIFDGEKIVCKKLVKE